MKQRLSVAFTISLIWCTSASCQTAGGSSAQQPLVGRPAAVPSTPPETWIDEVDDYPNSAFNLRQGGTVESVLLVGQSGLVTECTVVGSSHVRVLDDHTCRLLTQRARFLRSPTPAIYRHVTVWDIPKAPLPQCFSDWCRIE